MPTRLRIFITLLTTAAFGLFIILAMRGQYFFDWQSLVFFSVLVFLAENFCIDLPKAGAVSVTFTIILAGIILFGPALPAIASIFAAVIWRDLKNGTHPFRWVFNGAQYAVTTALAGLTYVGAGGPVLVDLSRGFTVDDFPSVLLPLLLAIIVFFLANTSLVSTIIGLAEGMQPLSVWLVNVRWAVPNYFALAPLGLAVAQIYMATGGVGVTLMVVPLIVARQTFQVYMRLRNAYLGTVQSLIAALEAKDPYTRGHSERVSKLAHNIGKQLKLSAEDLETLEYAGILHDIGKVGTARYILRKPGKLTEDEYQRIRLHPESGALILREIRFLNKAVPAIFHHHEHFDGTGYIDGIKGEEIPLLARILTVADAYDAMTSPRPYRAAMPVDTACLELIACSGSQFDPAIVAAFLKSIGYRETDSEVPEGQLSFNETPA